MLRAALFYPVDSYPLDRRFIHWIGLIHWISYPPFEQPAPVVYIVDMTNIQHVLIHIIGDSLQEAKAN